MRRNWRLWFGPLSALIFVAGVIGLGWWVPGYDPVRQTVSEIGEIGSPARWPFALLLWMVSFCLALFALGVRQVAVSAQRDMSPLLIGWMAVAAAALGFFAHPHPLHNWFGLSELIAYQAPLAFALAWRGAPGFGRAVIFSVAMYALTLLSVGVNLAAIFDNGTLWQVVAPFYGLLQRVLFGCFFVWTAGLGFVLLRRTELAAAATA